MTLLRSASFAVHQIFRYCTFSCFHVEAVDRNRDAELRRCAFARQICIICVICKFALMMIIQICIIYAIFLSASKFFGSDFRR